MSSFYVVLQKCIVVWFTCPPSDEKTITHVTAKQLRRKTGAVSLEDLMK